MKLSNNTLVILKNFSDINTNLTIVPGNTIKTVHNPATIYSEAKIEETFEYEFGIYDLKEFLATVAMFKDPELTFTDTYVDITDSTDSSIRTRYFKAEPKILTPVPQLRQMPETDIKFEISELNFKRIERASATLKCPDVRFVGGDGKIVANVCDKSGSTENTFKVSLTDNYTGPDFDVYMRQDKLMIINGDYDCSIIANQIFKCDHQGIDLSYVISLDTE